MRSISIVVTVATATGCGQSTKPAPAPDTTKLHFDRPTLALDDNDNDVLELGLAGSDGTPVTQLATSQMLDIQVEVDAMPHDKVDAAQAANPAGDAVLCIGTTSVMSAADATTERFSLKLTNLSSRMAGARDRPCVAALVDASYHAPLYVHLSANEVPDAEIKIDAPADHRAANLPALDAEIARLEAGAAKLSGSADVPACTAALVGDKPLEASFGGADPDPLSTPLFLRLGEYAQRHDSQPDVTLAMLSKQTKLGYYIASKFALPAVSGSRFTPGVFDGRLVVVDAATVAPLCAIPLHAESSHELSAKSTLDEHGRTIDSSAGSVVEHDFRDHLGQAVTAAFAAFPAARPSRP
nr:hypothetical protein [Kofleriaceae bacterium]